MGEAHVALHLTAAAPIVAFEDDFVMETGTSTTLDVLSNDLLPAGERSLVVEGAVPEGSVEIDGSGSSPKLVYTPDEGAAGESSFTYRIMAGGENDSARVTVTARRLGAREVHVQAGFGTAAVSWTPPRDDEFTGTIVRYKPLREEFDQAPVTVRDGRLGGRTLTGGHLRLENLDPDKEYGVSVFSDYGGGSYARRVRYVTPGVRDLHIRGPERVQAGRTALVTGSARHPRGGPYAFEKIQLFARSRGVPWARSRLSRATYRAVSVTRTGRTRPRRTNGGSGAPRRPPTSCRCG